MLLQGRRLRREVCRLPNRSRILGASVVSALSPNHPMTSPNLDIDMMRLFKALCDCGSLSLAAKELNVSIPAASRLLAKLRQVFGEDLFLRGAHGMTPSIRATELYAPIAGMLASYGKLFVCAIPEPGSMTTTIRIGARSELDFTYLDTALAHVLAKAPNLSIELAALGDDLEEAIVANRIDLAFGARGDSRPGRGERARTRVRAQPSADFGCGTQLVCERGAPNIPLGGRPTRGLARGEKGRDGRSRTRRRPVTDA